MEDFVTWTDTSKIRKHVLDYHGQVELIIVFACIYDPFDSVAG